MDDVYDNIWSNLESLRTEENILIIDKLQQTLKESMYLKVLVTPKIED